MPDGQWLRGWEVEGKDGQWYPCGVLCDRQAPDYARQRIPEELKTHPYRCRFIDTTTAAPWRECYDAAHPLTRSESRHWKMELLKYVSEDCRLVTGSETGHEAAVPYVHYFEGMLSLGPYRVPDAGRDMHAGLGRGSGAAGEVPDGPFLPPAALGTGLSRLRGGPVVLGRLQQQAAEALGPPRPDQRPLRHAADVHVQPQAVAGSGRSGSSAATGLPPRSPGPPATRKCSPIAG